MARGELIVIDVELGTAALAGVDELAASTTDTEKPDDPMAVGVPLQDAVALALP
jgi:hypothetical protein